MLTKLIVNENDNDAKNDKKETTVNTDWNAKEGNKIILEKRKKNDNDDKMMHNDDNDYDAMMIMKADEQN